MAAVVGCSYAAALLPANTINEIINPFRIRLIRLVARIEL